MTIVEIETKICFRTEIVCICQSKLNKITKRNSTNNWKKNDVMFWKKISAHLNFVFDRFLRWCIFHWCWSISNFAWNLCVFKSRIKNCMNWHWQQIIKTIKCVIIKFWFIIWMMLCIDVDEFVMHIDIDLRFDAMINMLLDMI